MPAAPFDTDFAHGQYQRKYAWDGEEWDLTAKRVTGPVMGSLLYAPRANAHRGLIAEATERVGIAIQRRSFIPGGRYLANVGREFHQVNNCFLLNAEDSREGWATLAFKSAMSLMTGGGIGVYYGKVRGAEAPIGRTGGVASGPVPLAGLVNDQGRAYVQGGNRRAAIWAGLLWSHPDIFDFIRSKDWPQWLRDAKEDDPTVAAPFDMTNISVCLDDEFFRAVREPSYTRLERIPGTDAVQGVPAPDGGSWHEWAKRVYAKTVDKMVTTGEPGFSVDTGDKVDEKLRNACTEIVSADDSDVCNLGSIVLPRAGTPEQFGAACRDAVLYLTGGTLYSDVPYRTADLPYGQPGVDEVREKNRRLGLGIIGVHEFVMQHGARYGTPESFELLAPYYEQYARALEWANTYQDMLGLSLSIAATAEAPNGTIGIVAESTPSADPLFAPAEERTVYKRGPRQDVTERHYVVDPVAARLMAAGVDPKLIEGAHDIDHIRRLEMQKFQQGYTDQAVSSTMNLPHAITGAREQELIGSTFLRYLPHLRGLTCYPDEARAGQPRRPVSLEFALSQSPELATEDATCNGAVCGV